ncbi:MAG: peptide deformylase [Nitriliruptorales bacterium]|nr:peptide deformylase [Nitriliruptorales bacterium]
MSVLKIRLFGDPVLRQQANEVDEFDDRLAKLAGDMFDTMRDAPGVGLAAPQVGILKQLFVWEVDEDSGAVVNPEVVDTSEEIQEGEEGCLSFPGLFYPLDRPLRAQISYHDLGGEQHTAELEGFHARVWLHEIDHLNGILFIDHLAKHDKKDAMRRMREHRLELGMDDAEPQRPGNLLLGRRSL